jgi:hypothetical protein
VLCVGVRTSLSERCTRVEQSDETNVTHGTYEGAISRMFTVGPIVEPAADTPRMLIAPSSS